MVSSGIRRPRVASMMSSTSSVAIASWLHAFGMLPPFQIYQDLSTFGR